MCIYSAPAQDNMARGGQPYARVLVRTCALLRANSFSAQPIAAAVIIEDANRQPPLCPRTSPPFVSQSDAFCEMPSFLGGLVFFHVALTSGL